MDILGSIEFIWKASYVFFEYIDSKLINIAKIEGIVITVKSLHSI